MYRTIWNTGRLNPNPPQPPLKKKKTLKMLSDLLLNCTLFEYLNNELFLILLLCCRLLISFKCKNKSYIPISRMIEE